MYSIDSQGETREELKGMETKREVVSSLYNGNREYMYREEPCSEGIVRCALVIGRC